MAPRTPPPRPAGGTVPGPVPHVDPGAVGNQQMQHVARNGAKSAKVPPGRPPTPEVETSVGPLACMLPPSPVAPVTPVEPMMSLMPPASTEPLASMMPPTSSQVCEAPPPAPSPRTSDVPPRPARPAPKPAPTQLKGGDKDKDKSKDKDKTKAGDKDEDKAKEKAGAPSKAKDQAKAKTDEKAKEKEKEKDKGKDKDKDKEKGEGEDKEKDKEGGDKEKEKGKGEGEGGAAAGGGKGGKGGKGKGGGAGGGGGGGEGEGGGAEAGGAGAGEEEMTVILEPPPPPRLGGTEAVHLSMPLLQATQLERVRSQTGLTVAEHFGRVQGHLDHLSARADREQRAIVFHIDLVTADVAREMDETAARIPPLVASAIGGVHAAYGGARALITTVSEEALKTIESHATQADRDVDVAALTSKQAVENAVLASSPAIQKLYEETMKPLRQLLTDTSGELGKVGTSKSGEMVKQGDVVAKEVLGKGATAVEIAQAEKQSLAVPDLAKAAGADLDQAGKDEGQDILAQEPTFGMSFLMLVNPAAVKVEEVGGEDAATCTSKAKETRIRLTTDYERARSFVETTRDRALKSLEAGEKSAVAQLAKVGRRLEAMARSRKERLLNGIQHAAAPAADAWAQQMTRVNRLVPSDPIVDARRLEPRLFEAMESMNALAATQRADFDAQVDKGLADARQGFWDDRKSLDDAAAACTEGAGESQKQASAMRQIADDFAGGFRRVANPSSSAQGEFATSVEEKLGASVVQVRASMKKLLADTTPKMKKLVTNFTTQLDGQVKGLGESLQPALDDIGVKVIEDFKGRSQRAFAAMDRVGTDEEALLRELHNLTPEAGKGLEEYWDTTGHGPNLRWWLDDELSGDEYDSAIAYLDGDPVKGALLELKTTQHWYGNDTRQIETALRALDDKQREALRNKPGFDAVQKDIEGSYTGTDLDVAKALIAGRTARADALRLKQQIDAARTGENDDKLHDALAGVDPKNLPEVQREFTDILAGNPMTEKKPDMADPEAARKLSEYATRPVEIYEPGDPETGAGGYYRTATLSEPSRQLAAALATKGEGSPEARAARGAFEAQRGGKPRADRLEKAFNDPELDAARNNPILTTPNANPHAVERARARLDELEKRRSETMQQFAALRGADEATRKDPARAREYTANAVGALFGDDALGRELGTSMVNNGRANPAVAIKFAVRGTGTNEEMIRRTLRGMTPAQIEALKKDYADRFGNPRGNPDALFDDLGVFQNAETAKAAGVKQAHGGGFFTELSGDERQEVERLLVGTPQNDRDRYRLARLDYTHQRVEGSTWATHFFTGEDSVPPGLYTPERALDANHARLTQMVNAAGGEEAAFDPKTGNFVGVPGRFGKNDFRIAAAGTSEAAANYKHHIDMLADLITGSIAIIGAIVGTIVVTVLTAGTATPLVIGLWAAGIAAATGAAAMAVNYAMKGKRYGWEQAAVDGALTLLDAATAGLMAGAGAKAARAATQMAALKAAARTPSQVALAEKMAARQTQKEFVRGFVRAGTGGMVSGTARTALTDGTWDEGILKGIGTSVGGGLKAAAIGIATHGATTGFNHAVNEGMLGQGVKSYLGSQSTSYFGRGLGAGLGGALGGMAGRTTDVGIDALTGHKVGPWYEVLGEIVKAGGRGFVENFGQGMAEVPKNRRDQAQARLEQEHARAEAARVARQGTGGQDEIADARFRQKAAAVAKQEDRKLDVKSFLAELDRSVTSDRALAETTRQLQREFRREALAGIPPEQRGEFANVPIVILPDADFERFSGSKSGRAVTIFVDGEPQIIARKSATPETLREEGIHVLQSKDPAWRDRIARLDERKLAHWSDADVESRVSLYKDKLAVEIDGQQRVRQSLLDEAERTSDPARRARLLERAEATEHTEAQLRLRGAEVEGLGPDRLAAIRAGREPMPQYLEEPPRLFSKVKAEVAEAEKPHKLPKPPVYDDLQPDLYPKRSSPLEHGSPELAHEPRRPVKLANSTWEADHPGRRMYQVGDAWTESEMWVPPGKRKPQSRDRWYRMVEVVDEAGSVIDRRREILQVGGRWQQRGSESSTWGAVFEKASRLRTIAKIEAGLGRPIDIANDPVVPIGSLRDKAKGTPMSAQHGGGAGFDDVVFRFTKGPGGIEVAHITVVEAKGRRRALTLEDFSAITANYPTNMAELQNAVLASNLSVDRKKAVLRALASHRVGLEIHVSPTAKVAGIESDRGTILRTVADTVEAWRQLGTITASLAQRRDALGNTPAEKKQRAQLTGDLQQLEALRTRLETAFQTQPFDAARVERALRPVLAGTRTFESAGEIAARHGIDVAERRALVRKETIHVDGADKQYIADARAATKGARGNLGRAPGYAIGLAEAIGSAGRGLENRPTVGAVPPDVQVLSTKDGKRSLAVTSPADVNAGTTPESAASRQILGLLRDGVATDRGTIRPDHVVWEATLVPPSQRGEIGRVLDQVRRAGEAHLDDLRPLRVTVPGDVAKTPAELRAQLRLGPEVRISELARPPEGRTWVLSFQPPPVTPAASAGAP
jgi:hypothetical protein